MNTLIITAIVTLVAGLLSCAIISLDVIRHPQKMGIMNIVWPVTALYAGPLALWAYYRIGRKSSRTRSGGNRMAAEKSGATQGKMGVPWQSVVTGTLHCGSGCTVGDLLAEVFLWLMPVSLAGSRLLGTWAVEYGFAFAAGILFQYFAIRPMKKLSRWQAVLAALKADALSLTCWQVGMYGWMAIAIFGIFHHRLQASDPVFWFQMQIGMLVGFLTAWPVNWLLLKKGVKEAM